MKEQVLAVQRMQDYIEKNRTEEISLSELAQASLFSPWYSYRLFRERLGLTPTEYIRKYRLTQAARQLRQWGLTPRAWLRQMDARHIFTHIRWEMTGYLVQVEGLGPADWLWADGARRQRLAIPSAFDQFTRALPAEGD